MRKFFIALLVVVIAIAICAYVYLKPAQPVDSQVFINATVLSMDANNTRYEAIAVKNNRIVAVGSNEDISTLINADTLVHDLKGKTLMPGFIDAHGHFPGSGMFRIHADLRSPPMGSIETMAQLQSALSATMKDKEVGEWVIGMGYDDTLLAEKRHPTREDLDAVSTQHPMFIVHTSGHMGVGNSLALEMMHIDADTEAPVGGVIVKDPSTGEPTGLLEETAMVGMLDQAMNFSLGDIRALFFGAIDEYAAAGMTTAQSGGMPLELLKGMSMASRLGLIPFRLELWPFYRVDQPGLFSALSDGSFKGADYENEYTSVNRVKITADGSIQGYTGYLTQPYHTDFRGDQDYRGYPTMPRETLVEQVATLHQNGYRIAVHGNGDAAIDDILDAYESALQLFPSDDPRFIIVHAQMAREDQLVRMKELGVTPTFFSAHTYYWGDRHRDIFMGPERADRMSPTKSAENLGLKFSVHMDTPVAPMEPLTLVWSTVNRRSTGGHTIGAEQQVSPISALRAVTIDAAYQIFRDHDLGSIEVGKLADLVVLDQNPIAIDPAEINSIRVEQTVVNGVTIYRRQH